MKLPQTFALHALLNAEPILFGILCPFNEHDIPTSNRFGGTHPHFDTAPLAQLSSRTIARADAL